MQDDIRHVHIRVTAALGIAAAVVTQIKLEALRALDGYWQAALLVGLGLMVLASLCYFQYTQELNKARIEIAARSTGLRVKPDDAPSGWALEPWLRFITPRAWAITLYKVAQGAFLLGGAALVPALYKLLA